MNIEEKNKVLEASVEEKDAEIAALKEQIASAQNGVQEKKQLPTFKVANDTFQFNYTRFVIDNTTYEAEKVKDDKALCAKIVENYAGLVSKVK